MAADCEPERKFSIAAAVSQAASINRLLSGASAILLAVVLAGCGLVSENTASSIFVAPGKYDIYNCDQLFEAGRTLTARERELSELMARAAADGATGEFVGAVAYRTELVQTRGWLKQIGDVSVQKNCAAQSKWQSDRALW